MAPDCLREELESNDDMYFMFGVKLNYGNKIDRLRERNIYSTIAKNKNKTT